MNSNFKNMLIERVATELNYNGFYLVDSSNNYLVYHRKGDLYIEIVQIGKDKYETYVTVSASIVFLHVSEKKTNINYPFFYEFSNGMLDKISVDDCIEKYFLKGNFGNAFHYGDVYLVLGRGICGIAHDAKKPLGIRLKKFNSRTYEKISDIIIKRLKKAYCWLEKKKNSVP